MKQKVSDLVADFLAEKGIRHVFGIVGAGDAHLFDSIYKKGFTQIICVHHEQAATMAMQTYYRTRGQMAAAILTTGAGSTNGVTGVVSAWADSIPGMIIAGNENHKFTSPQNPLRMWGVQGYDSVQMVEKVTKYATRVMEPTQSLLELEKAYCIALEGRPGPTWVEIPMSIQSSLVEVDQLPKLPRVFPQRPAPVTAHPHVLHDAKAAAAEVHCRLASAQRPVIWLGHGIRLAGGVELIEPLLKALNVPALVSWAGIDMLDSRHPLFYGSAGVYGQRAANFVLQNSDFVLTIGTRLALPQIGYDLTEFARAAKLIVNDIDESEATKLGERTDLAVVADAKEFMRALLTDAPPAPVRAEWHTTCSQYRVKYPWIGPEHADQDGFINSYTFMDRLSSHLKDDQIIVTDMGTALLSGHQALKLKRGQRLMTSTGLGEMGYGLPGAIGASFARDRGEVMCLNCDGGMMMNLQELQTMVHHRLPIKLFIFNNDGYLMIKHTQKALFEGRYSGTNEKSGVSCPDYSKLAKAFDVPAYQIRSWEDFQRVVPEVQSQKGPVICEVFMHPQQLFVPKLSLATQKDGSLISPPLEDLSPLLPREELKRNMIIGLHPKSAKMDV